MVTLTTTHDTKHNITWARLVSNIFSPPVIWGAMAFPIAYREALTDQQGLSWALTYIALVCIAPGAYVAWMVKRGQITDLHMRVRTQRIRPLLVTIFCALIATLVLKGMHAPPILTSFTLITVIQIAVMLMITMVWQISMHTMSVSSAVIAAALLFGLGTALLASPLIPIVGAARYSLRRHTLSQLIAGGLLGSVLTLGLLLAMHSF